MYPFPNLFLFFVANTWKIPSFLVMDIYDNTNVCAHLCVCSHVFVKKLRRYMR
jgi:hypothetical protein